MKILDFLKLPNGKYILRKVMGKDEGWLYLYGELPVPIEAEKIYQKSLQGYPLEYQFNEVFFYGEKFYIKEGVLIPRDDTEVVLERALQFIRDHREQIRKVVDVGTGSGVLAILIKKEFPELEVVGTDISPVAIEVAKRNRAIHQVEVEFRLESFFSDPDVDLVISNPPYVEEGHPLPNPFEPKEAFYGGGKDGLEFTKRLIRHSIKKGVKWGILEIGALHQKELEEWLKGEPGIGEVEFFKDYLGNWRGVIIGFNPIDLYRPSGIGEEGEGEKRGESSAEEFLNEKGQVKGEERREQLKREKTSKPRGASNFQGNFHFWGDFPDAPPTISHLSVIGRAEVEATPGRAAGERGVEEGEKSGKYGKNCQRETPLPLFLKPLLSIPSLLFKLLLLPLLLSTDRNPPSPPVDLEG
jgi:release factor glutamine methyltransferase